LLERFSILQSNGDLNAAAEPEEYLGAALEESLQELILEDRLLLTGKYIEGATVRELSSQIGLTEKAVESRLLRLRRRLRESLLKKLNLP
jgi:RNA polymerase sigma-70 factor (ECF subfamily)